LARLNWILVTSTTLVLVLGAWGCRVEPESDVGGLDLRLIGAPPDAAFDLELYRVTRRFSDGGSAAGARDGTPGDRGCVDGSSSDRIEIASGWGFVSATRDVDWRADDLDGFEFGISGLSEFGRNLRVYWAGPGENFSEDRAAGPVQKSDELWQMNLASHPGWNGQITKIRVDLPGPSEGSTVLHSLNPILFDYDLERIRAATGRFWKVDLADDVRSAALITGDRELVWELERPTTGALIFSYGTLGVPQNRLRLVVQVLGTRDRWVEVFAAGGDVAEEPEGRAQLDPGWVNVRVELERYGPVRAVKFSVEGLGPGGRYAGIAAVANPVITHGGREQSKVNVLLISLDTLRADRLGIYGYDRNTSPNIDSRASRSGVVFSRNVAPSPRTLPSHTSMLTGLDCLSHGVNHHSPAPRSLQTLAEILRDQGYSTVATVGGGLMNPAFGLDQGFDEYYHYSGWAGGFGELEAEMKQAMDKLARHADRPFFMFFHTYEIHDPYHARRPYTDACYAEFDIDPQNDLVFGALPRPRSEEERFLLFFDLMKWRRQEPVTTAVPVDDYEIRLANCLYDAGITFADAQVELLLKQLESRRLLLNTLVVITSDHGESLGEKGLFKHAYLSENNLMVPLIFLLPAGLHRGTVVDRQVATVDIVPTILDVLGIEPPSRMDGESLLPLMEDGGVGAKHRSEAWSYAAFENRGLSLRLDDRIKYTFNNSAPSAAHGEEELFMLDDDPGDLDNLASQEPRALERLRLRLKEYYEARAVGSTLVIDNIDCERVEGVISAQSLTTRAKALELDGSAVHWISHDQVGIAVPAERRLRLWIEATDVIEVELTAGGCGGFDQSLTLSRPIHIGSASETVTLGLARGAWFDVSADWAETDLSVRVTAGGVRTSSGPVDDFEVLDQLRSLGYLE
jgi:arylsulfatase A-like enzyme